MLHRSISGGTLVIGDAWVTLRRGACGTLFSGRWTERMRFWQDQWYR
jgi:hypothetical protein